MTADCEVFLTATGGRIHIVIREPGDTTWDVAGCGMVVESDIGGGIQPINLAYGPPMLRDLCSDCFRTAGEAARRTQR